MFDNVRKTRQPLDFNRVGPWEPYEGGADREPVNEFVYWNPYVDTQNETWTDPGIRNL